jgi:hypothetical protein
MKKKKGVCHLESGHVIRAQFDVDEENTDTESENTYSHPFTGESCKTVEFEEDEDK